MESNIAASTIWLISCGNNFASNDRVNSTKPNSPACARPSPLRIPTPQSPLYQRASSATMAALNNSKTSSSNSTQPRLDSNSLRLSSMPMVTKNNPIRTSRKGLMSSSTW